MVESTICSVSPAGVGFVVLSLLPLAHGHVLLGCGSSISPARHRGVSPSRLSAYSSMPVPVERTPPPAVHYRRTRTARETLVFTLSLRSPIHTIGWSLPLLFHFQESTARLVQKKMSEITETPSLRGMIQGGDIQHIPRVDPWDSIRRTSSL